MYSTAVRRSAPQHADSLSNRIPLPPIDCPTALVFAICSPNSQPAARTGGNHLCPLPSVGSSWLLHSISLILKAKLALLGQIRASRQMHNSAQIRPLTGQVFAIFGRWGRRVPKLLSRNSEEVRRKRLEKDKLFNPRGLVTCDRRRLLRAPPASSAFPLPYWPVKSPIVHNCARPQWSSWTGFPRSGNGGLRGPAQRAPRPRICPA
jgi:hypothetical protein